MTHLERWWNEYAPGLAVLLVLVIACKKKTAADMVDFTPPPMLHGKCVVEHYKFKMPDKSACAFEGYLWHCVEYECTRGEALPPQAEAEIHTAATPP